MKHGMKPNRREKELLSENNLNPKKYLKVKRTHEFVEFVEVATGKLICIRY